MEKKYKAYCKTQFEEDVYTLKIQVPSESDRKASGCDEFTVFWGRRDWENIDDDMSHIAPENRLFFVLTMFAITIFDMNMYSNFPKCYEIFRHRLVYPKFGWCGFGCCLENPYKILFEPLKRGYIKAEDVVDFSDMFTKALQDDWKKNFEDFDYGVTASEFIKALSEDSGMNLEGRFTRADRKQYEKEISAMNVLLGKIKGMEFSDADKIKSNNKKENKFYKYFNDSFFEDLNKLHFDEIESSDSNSNKKSRACWNGKSWKSIPKKLGYTDAKDIVYFIYSMFAITLIDFIMHKKYKSKYAKFKKKSGFPNLDGFDVRYVNVLLEPVYEGIVSISDLDGEVEDFVEFFLFFCDECLNEKCGFQIDMVYFLTYVSVDENWEIRKRKYTEEMVDVVRKIQFKISEMDDGDEKPEKSNPTEEFPEDIPF